MFEVLAHFSKYKLTLWIRLPKVGPILEFGGRFHPRLTQFKDFQIFSCAENSLFCKKKQKNKNTWVLASC